MNRLRAMLHKEMMTVLRSRKAFWLLTITLIGCAFGFWIAWKSIGSSLDAGLEGRTEMSRAFFTALLMIELIAFSICAPALSAGTVTIERERRTLDLLYCTGLRAVHILLGKWLSVIAFVVLVLVMLLPIEALLFSLGGVGYNEYIHGALIIATVVLTYGMFGIYISSRTRRSTTAVVATIGILALYNFGVPVLIEIIDASMAFSGMGGNWMLMMLGMSPAATLASVVEDISRAGFGVSLTTILSVFYATHAMLFAFSARGALRRLTFSESVPVVARPSARVSSKMSLAVPEPNANWQGLRGWMGGWGSTNPVFQREIMFGTIGRGRSFALLLILALLFSLFGLLFHNTDPSNQAKALATIIILYILVLLPAWGATAISSEREEMTWPLLRVTPLTERQVLLGKFAAYFKTVVVITLAISGLPLLIGMTSLALDLKNPADLAADFISITLPTVFGYAVFIGALMLFWSGRSRTNATAVTSTYVTLFLINVLPAIARGWFGDYVLECTSNLNWIIPPAHRWHMWLPGIYMHIVSPLLSPFIFLNDSRSALNVGHWGQDSYGRAPETDTYWSAIAYVVLLGLAAWGILRCAERSLRRAEGEGSAE